jgi:hypothetical protein
MIDRYAHPSMNHKREALEKLSKVPLDFTLSQNRVHPSNLTTTPTGENIRVI